MTDIKEPKNCGIYCWTSPSGKKYVGQAQDLTRRKKEFLRFGSKYSNGAVDNARKKYNEASMWTYEILEVCTLEELNEREMFWIIESRKTAELYNLNDGGDGQIGKTYSEESKLKISNSVKEYFSNPDARKRQSEIRKKYFLENPDAGKKISEAKKGKSNPKKFKPIIMMDLDGNPIMEFESINAAGEYVKAKNVCNISTVCHGKKNSCYGYRWAFKSDYENGIDRFYDRLTDEQKEFADSVGIGNFIKSGGISKIGKKHTEKDRDNMSYSQRRRYGRLFGDIDTESIEYKLENFIRNKPHKTERGKTVPVVQLSLDCTPLKEWDCASTAAKENQSLNVCAIIGVCRGRNRTSGGFRWVYKSDWEEFLLQNDSQKE